MNARQYISERNVRIKGSIYYDVVVALMEDYANEKMLELLDRIEENREEDGRGKTTEAR